MPFLLSVEMAESTEAATKTLTSHCVFSVQYNPVSWALCHVWTDYTLHPTQSVPEVTAQRGCCYCRKTLLLAEGEVICSAAKDGSGSELNRREKD